MSNEDIKNRKTGNNNTWIVISSFLLLFIICTVIVIYLFMGKSDYEKGNNYLKEKKLTEALYEFQKVSPDDKEFLNAQSKINYINGLKSFNEGRNPEAIVFLSKVGPQDEYYHDSQLMLEKINGASIGNNLQSQIDSLKNKKDTVIVQKQVTVNHGTTKDPVDPAIQADLEITRKFVSDASNSISRFESVYQSARTAPLTTKSDYSKSLESVDKEFGNIRYAANNKDAGVIELRRIAAEWMSKRISFIRQLISERSVSETNLSRPLKEEGDRLYSSMMTQMNKVKKRI